MLRYVVGRCLALFPVLLGVSILVFLMLHMVPGDVAEIIAAQTQARGGPEQVAEIREQLGLNDPVHVQYVRFFWNALHGDFGRSHYTNRPVTTSIAEMLPHTFQLAGAATAISVIVGVGLGVLAAVRHNTWVDRVAMILALGGLSIPIFWSGLILILVFGVMLNWLPITGGTPWEMLILPAAALGYDGAAFVARLTRSSMLEVLRQDYMVTARAKGLHQRSIIVGHGLRNALLPIITIVGLLFGRLLGGTVVVEAVFARPGLGRLAVEAILYKDFLLVQGVVMVAAVTYVLINLLTDLSYTWLDPRVRYA
jgi:ABC-type dipeptide/oligopeptide/nickel transport system permease component